MKKEMIKEPVKGAGKYKQTEIGIIPSDWGINKLSEITTLMTNGFVGTVTSFYSESDSDILYIQGYNVEENGFNFKGIKYVTKDLHKQHSKSSLQEGDLLTIQTGDVGLTTIVPKELVGSNCHALIISRFKKEICNSKYYSYYFNSFEGRSRLKSIETGTTMKHINVGNLLQFVVPLPPTLAEQTAIATSLSDADDLISNLEKLIEKKRNIKQGAMQQLLSPTTPDGKLKKGWTVKKLGEVCNRITTGKLDANAMNPDGEYRFYTCAKSFYHIDIFAFDDEALLVSGNGENVGYVHYFKGKFNAYQRTYVLTGFKENIQFIKKYLDKFLAARIESEMNAGNTPYIKMGTLSDMDIFLPNEIDEQNYIAKILENMNLEIELIEIKLDKAKKIKQGMMQNLLTGKIRLV
jgi:type I restriction enzyme S subunit